MTPVGPLNNWLGAGLRSDWCSRWQHVVTSSCDPQLYIFVVFGTARGGDSVLRLYGA